ncbi:MAG: hypothetical protein O7B24_07355 [Alphaproteobacteria bacterium]|nr:hypothetical protein [Alphaproteobacteria bacterium]
MNHDICRLCGQPGDVLYRDLTDRLFSVPRAWNFRRCRNAACRLVWLDPQPAEEDFPLIYEDYGTHGGAPDSNGGKIDGQVKSTGGVCLDYGKYGQMALRTQENRKIRPSIGCGENSVPSTVVRGHDLRKPGGHLGNVG